MRNQRCIYTMPIACKALVFSAVCSVLFPLFTMAQISSDGPVAETDTHPTYLTAVAYNNNGVTGLHKPMLNENNNDVANDTAHTIATISDANNNISPINKQSKVSLKHSATLPATTTAKLLFASNAGPDRTACKTGGNIYITGTPAGGVWTETGGDPAGAILFPVATSDSLTVKFSSTGTYNFIYTAGGVSDAMIVTVKDCGGPGGVSSHLSLWLKANAGTSTTTNNSTVNTWRDTTSNAFSLAASNSPLYISNGVNYNPAIWYASSALHFSAGLPAMLNSTVFLAGTPLESASDDSYNTSWLSNSKKEFPLNFSAGSGGAMGHFSTTSFVETYVCPWAYNEASFAKEQIFSDKDAAISKQGAVAKPLPGAIATLNQSYMFLGGYYPGNQEGFGKIAETFIYDTSELPAIDVQKIESYLGLKYGVTLDQATAQNYIASNGTTTMWNAAAAATGYKYDIFGIGKDVTGGLDQRISQSANTTGGLLAVATTNNFLLPNNDASRSALSNLNFETIANNNGAASWTSANAPNGYNILSRKWQVQETGSIAAVQLQFDVDNAAFDIPALLGGTKYYIITDPNADGVYTDGVITALTNTSASLWSIAIDLANGSAFTLATVSPGAGPDLVVCKSGAKIYLTGTPSTGAWKAATGNPAGANLIATGTAGLNYVTFTNTGTYNFVFTNGGVGDTMNVTVNDCGTPGGVSTHLVFWLKGNAGTNTIINNAIVSTWADTVASAKTLVAKNSPLYIADGINFNPAVLYSHMAYHSITGLPSLSNSTVYIAGTPLAASSNDGYNDAWTSDDGNEFPLINNSTQVGHYGGAAEAYAYPWAGNEPSFAREHITTRDAAVSKQGAVAVPMPGAIQNINRNYLYLGGSNLLNESFGKIAETFIYDTSAMPASDLKKIDSYMAFKYGLTLDKSAGGTAGDYVLSDGSTAWGANANAGYDNKVIALVRDDASALVQKQAHTADDSLRLFAGSLATTNSANTGTISNNLSSLIIASNGGKTEMSKLLPMPAGIKNILRKTWKVTNNNFTNSFSIEIKWDSSSIINISTLRLLVSSSEDFSNAASYTAPAVTISAGSIIVSGISNSIIGTNTSSFITVGSTSLTLMPVTAVFNANVIDGSKVSLTWQTTSEINNDYFSVERSAAGINWVMIAKVNGAGNSSWPINYGIVDKNPYAGVSYYRFKQTDLDGTYKYSDVHTVKIDKTKSSSLAVYPNPVLNQLTIKGDITAMKTFTIFNVSGQDVTGLVKTIEINSTGTVLNVSALAKGTYSIKTNNTTIKIMKL